MNNKPSNGIKTKKPPPERDEHGRFIKGNTGGGRKQKPAWLNGKGIEALQYAYDVMLDTEQKTDLRLQAARMLAEYDLGKPRQQVDVDALNVAPVVIYGTVPD